MNTPKTTVIPLIGYSDRLSARPGDTIEFKVSSISDQPFSADLIRVICADPNPAGPGLIEEDVDIDFGGSFPSRHQPFSPGSHAEVDTGHQLEHLNDFSLSVNIWPTNPQKGWQCFFSVGNKRGHHGLDLGINHQGLLCLKMMDEEGSVSEVSVNRPLKIRQWYRIGFSYDAAAQTVLLGHQSINQTDGDLVSQSLNHPISLKQMSQVRFAADHQSPALNHFNGKIESPMIFDRYLDSETLLKDIEAPAMHWDFSRDISSTVITDIGPHRCHGELINYPARAMTGSNWDGSDMCWRHALNQYGAIHFHDDDIYDFRWQTDFSFTVPDKLKPGVYAARIRCEEHTDKIPFFVCPPKGVRNTKLCVLVSTYTYTVYGNHARPDFVPGWLDRISEWNAYPWNPAAHSEYGLSTYNTHSDGSGICHASWKRPLMNLKPGYLTFGASENDCSGLRHFQADSHLITWLEWNQIDYDIITDQQLHDEGVEAIRGYTALTTGTHPEYHTAETLDAIADYRKHGGNLLYLGGNGFYWRIALHPEDNSMVEIRRGEGGIRAWAAEPGEYYQAFDGKYGGLWRRNGRPPQQIAGIGFSAQGTFQGSYYRRNNDAVENETTRWVFDGIDDVILGDFGLSGGGAAGFELDRVDHRLGSSEDIHILASSENHHDSFVLVPEEQLTHITNWPDKPLEDLIRADMIYQPAGESSGQLFASGSITFCGSLLHNQGDNNISKLLLNVVKRFTQQ